MTVFRRLFEINWITSFSFSLSLSSFLRLFQFFIYLFSLFLYCFSRFSRLKSLCLTLSSNELLKGTAEGVEEILSLMFYHFHFRLDCCFLLFSSNLRFSLWLVLFVYWLSISIIFFFSFVHYFFTEWWLFTNQPLYVCVCRIRTEFGPFFRWMAIEKTSCVEAGNFPDCNTFHLNGDTFYLCFKNIL